MTNRRGPQSSLLQKISWSLATLIPVIFLLAFFIYPVVNLLLRGFTADGKLDLSGFAQILMQARTWKIVRQTVVQASLATIICVILGVCGAQVLYRRRFPGRDLLRAFVVVPFVLPSVVVGVAFHALVTRGGLLGGIAGGSLDGSLISVVAALVFFNYGLMVRTVGNMWDRLDPRTLEAARALGASPWRAFCTVTLPSLAPAIASGAALTFLFCATAYAVVLLLGGVGVGTLETEIYTLTTQYLDLRGAAVLSVLQILLITLVLGISELVRRRWAAALKLRLDAPATRLRRGDLPALTLTVLVVVGLLIVPLATLVLRSLRRNGQWTVANYLDLGSTGTHNALLAPVWAAAGNSLQIALTAAALAMALGVCLALVLSRRVRRRAVRRAQTALDWFFLLPLGVSAVTVGFGFLVTWARPPLALTRSWWILPLAQAVVALPLVVRTLLPALRALDPRQREAAAALGASPLRVLLTVDGAQLLRAGGVALGFALATALGEFGATSFLARPQTLTLPVVIYRLMGSPGAQNQGMGLAAGTILAISAAAIMLGCEWLQGVHWRANRKP